MGQPLQAVRFLETHLRSAPASSGHNPQVGHPQPLDQMTLAWLPSCSSVSLWESLARKIFYLINHKDTPIFLTVVMTLTQAKLWS